MLEHALEMRRVMRAPACAQLFFITTHQTKRKHYKRGLMVIAIPRLSRRSQNHSGTRVRWFAAVSSPSSGFQVRAASRLMREILCRDLNSN